MSTEDLDRNLASPINIRSTHIDYGAIEKALD